MSFPAKSCPLLLNCLIFEGNLQVHGGWPTVTAGGHPCRLLTCSRNPICHLNLNRSDAAEMEDRTLGPGELGKVAGAPHAAVPTDVHNRHDAIAMIRVAQRFWAPCGYQGSSLVPFASTSP